MYFEELRKQYESEPLLESTIDPDPFKQLQAWIDAAIAHKIEVPNAMALATVDADHQPSVRMVLLKDLTPHGLTFFTHYESRKGRDLRVYPRASLLFYWAPQHRQVRVEGLVKTIPANESDAYFATRPRDSNLSAMASPQSRPIASRDELLGRIEALRQTWEGKTLERPEHWGGFRLAPESFEFFQGRADRVHDRLRYQRKGTSWVIDRLAP
jgi:pyridoxamine 5'-phosphate oxidase